MLDTEQCYFKDEKHALSIFYYVEKLDTMCWVGILCFFAGTYYRKRVGEREIVSAEQEATRIINEAIRSGESRKKEMLLEAKDEIHRSRTEHEKEVK